MSVMKPVKLVNIVNIVSLVKIETVRLSQIISWHLMCSDIKCKVYMVHVQNPQILQKSSESTDRSGFAEISIVEVELWRQNLPGVHHPFDLEGKIQITLDAWPISSNIELPLINRIMDI